MEKDYDHKISKIAATSNKWIRDDDISYLKMFLQCDVYSSGDSLIFKGEDENCTVYLIMTGSIVIPDTEDSTQLKLEALEQSSNAENSQTGIIEPIEQNNAQNGSNEEIEGINEFEEYDDPMA